MRKIQGSSEDEVIALFLQTEFHSSRFHQTLEALAQKVGIDSALFQTSNWHDARENTQRRALLGSYRGYGRNEGYFQGFPPNVCREWVTLTRQELEQVRYIVYDY